MDEPTKNMPREPADTQEWIREEFGAPSRKEDRPIRPRERKRMMRAFAAKIRQVGRD